MIEDSQEDNVEMSDNYTRKNPNSDTSNKESFDHNCENKVSMDIPFSLSLTTPVHENHSKSKKVNHEKRSKAFDTK